MAAPIIPIIARGALAVGRLATKKAIKLLKDNGVKADFKKGKIRAADVGVKSGKKPIKERTYTKIKKFSANPKRKDVKDFLGYESGGLIKGKPKLALRGWK